MKITLSLVHAQIVLNIKSFSGYENIKMEAKNDFIQNIISQLTHGIDFSESKYSVDNVISAHPLEIYCSNIYLFNLKCAFLSNERSFHFEVQLNQEEKLNIQENLLFY